MVAFETRPPLTAMFEGWEQLVADAAGAIVATPISIAATGTRRSPASSTDRFCNMNRAAPRSVSGPSCPAPRSRARSARLNPLPADS